MQLIISFISLRKMLLITVLSILLLPVSARANLDTWTLRAPTPFGSEDFNSIGFGNGLFVGIGNDGRIATSPEGINWTYHDSGITTPLNGITYGNNQFVAVGGNVVLTSPDGITWTKQLDLGYGVTFKSVAYGDGKYVAIGGFLANTSVNPNIYQIVMYTSLDGATWTKTSYASVSCSNLPGTSIFYGGGLFIVTASYTSYGLTQSSNVILTSSDGLSWTSRGGTGTSVVLNHVTYGNGLFVVVGSAGTVLTSPNGMLWTVRNTGYPIGLNNVAYGNQLFSAVGGQGYIFTSADGINWTPKTTDAVGPFTGIAYGNGRFVASNSLAKCIYNSNTGAVWNRSAYTNLKLNVNNTNPIYEPSFSIIHANGLFVGSGYNGELATSSDGANWTLRDSKTTSHLNAISFGNGLFVAPAGDYETTSISTSSDGINWNVYPAPVQMPRIDRIAFGNGQFVAITAGALSQIAVSSNGVDWTWGAPNDTETVFNVYQDIIFADGKFVLIGFRGSNTPVIYTSLDGLNWNISATPPSPPSCVMNGCNLVSVSYGNNYFVAGGTIDPQKGTSILTSTDGTIWTELANNLNFYPMRIFFGSSTFLASDGTSMYSSLDGGAWTVRNFRPLDFNDRIDGIAYYNGYYFANLRSNSKGPQILAAGEADDPIVFTGVLAGNGRITSTPNGIDCPGNSCNTLYSAGSSVTLTAQPGTGQRFVNWVGDCAGSGPCQFTLDTDHSTYAIFGDGILPAVDIVEPLTNSSQTDIWQLVATATDGTGVSAVEFSVNVMVNDVQYYLNNSRSFTRTTTPIWLTATYDPVLGVWYYDTQQVNWSDGKNYTVTARAIDNSDNQGTTVSAFTKVVVLPKDPSTLTLDLSSTSIQNDGTVTASGKLSRFCSSGNCNMINLQNRAITLTITAPDKSVTTLELKTTNINGSYTSQPINVFSQPGTYTIRVSYPGLDPDLQSSSSPLKTILVGKPAGYAIIIEGKIINDPNGTTSHTKSARRIYKTLEERNFTDDNIYWFNQGVATDPADGNKPLPVDDISPTKFKIGTLLDGSGTFVNGKTLADLMLANPAPLYVIMVDHGSPDAFHLGSETISPAELNTWLTTFDNRLSGSALLENKIFIIGACYSGSFLSGLSAPKRVIVTSASPGEQSYRGGYDGQDSIQSGEYFLDEFFAGLKRFSSIRTAFAEAAEKTWVYTRKSATASNGVTSSANAMQHPLLDDNGDRVGSTYPSDVPGSDGIDSSGIFLGSTTGVNSVDDPADLKEVAGTVFLSVNDTTLPSGQPLWAKALNNSQVSSLWVELLRPEATLTTTAGNSYQLFRPINTNDRQAMTGTNSQFEFGGFNFGTASSGYGKYEAYYYAIDVVTGNPSPSKRTVIYRDKPGNQYPNAVNLVEPGSDGRVPDLVNPGNRVDPSTVIFFRWGAGGDPDGDAVTYRLEICQDASFTASCIVRDELLDTAYLAGPEVGLQADSTYYWRVLTVDSYGKSTTSDYRSFTPRATNPAFPVMLKVVVTAADGLSAGTGLEGAQVAFGTAAPVATVPGGSFLTSDLPGTYTLSISKTNYQPQSFPVTLSSGVLPVYVTLYQVLEQTMSVTVSGSVNGTVTSTPPGAGKPKDISCTKSGGDCIASFTFNADAILAATPSWNALPAAWTGCDSIDEPTNNCLLKINNPRVVGAIFNPDPNFKTKVGESTYYLSLQDALENAASGSIVDVMAYTFPAVTFYRSDDGVITVNGGLESGYATSTGKFTVISGSLRLQRGTLKVKGPLAVR